MVLSIPVLDWKLRSRSVTSATKTFAKSKGAQFGPREPRKARPSVLPIQTTGTRVGAKRTAVLFRPTQARSKRSRFITLVQAATKSFANFSLESADA